jgi:hypothetical protein
MFDLYNISNYYIIIFYTTTKVVLLLLSVSVGINKCFFSSPVTTGRPSVNFSHFNQLLGSHRSQDQFEPNFGGMVLGWPPSKIVSDDPDFQPRWPPR